MAEERIDLNDVSAEALDQLPGIGPVLAQRIVDYRERVGPYERAEDLTSVAGIGENSVRRLADLLVVSASSETSAEGEESPPEPAPSVARPEPEPEPEAGPPPNALNRHDDDGRADEQEPAPVEVVPPGESLSEGGLELSLEERAGTVEEQESPEGASPEEEQEEPGMPTETPFSEGGLPEEKAGAEDAARAAPEDGTCVGPVSEPRGERGEPDELPPSRMGSPTETKPAPLWWRQFSWIWTALLGGLLGMVFALIVFAGINGSLDVGHSRAVLDIESDLRGLNREVEALQDGVDGIRDRLDALEDLTERMDTIESAVDDLTDWTSGLADRTDVLEEDVAGLSDDLQAVSEDLSELQDQAEQTRSFFSGLRMLLQDTFGGAEGAGIGAPTPTPEGK